MSHKTIPVTVALFLTLATSAYSKDVISEASLYTVKFKEIYALYVSQFKSEKVWYTQWDEWFDTASNVLCF